MKKIIITGATGSIGQKLLKELTARGNEVAVFTQNPQKATQKLPSVKSTIKWDYNNPNEWKAHLNGVDAVVHLAGANLGARRWNDEFKKLTYDSRIISTRNLIEAIKSVEQKPKAFICASAVGIYGNRYDEVLDETSLLGNDFLANLCKDWEKEAEKVEKLGVRRVSVRTGLVLIKDEGVLKKLLLPFKLFVGGPLGNGKQWVPWLHIDDIIGIYLHAIDSENVSGAVNAASPGIVRMKEFAKHFGKVLHRPSLLPAPKFILRIAVGEAAEAVTASQRIDIKKLLKSGYNFKFTGLDEAFKDQLII